MTHKLNDTHLLLLSGAAQRLDLCLAPADTLKDAARAKIATKLIGLGLVEEVATQHGMPVWREIEGEAIALRITTPGAAAIGAELPDAEAPRVNAAGASSAPRAGSKLAGVIALPSGARRCSPSDEVRGQRAAVVQHDPSGSQDDALPVPAPAK